MPTPNGSEVKQNWVNWPVANLFRLSLNVDTDPIAAADIGQFKTAVVNTYYRERFSNCGNSEIQEIVARSGAPCSKQGDVDRGLQANTSGAGVQ